MSRVRSVAKKLGGVLLLLVGAVLLVAPGPGIPLILVGLVCLGVGRS